MPKVQVNGVRLNYVEQGKGGSAVLAIHGNLGCWDWLSLALPLLPADLRVVAAEWRGSGDSDKPEPAADYGNYTMETHARDMLGLLDALGIQRCHLYGHSTGCLIASHLLLLAPQRFSRVLMLDPVTPLGLALAPGQLGVLAQMKSDPEFCYAGMASAVPTLFRPETLLAGRMPEFASGTSPAQRALFGRVVERTRLLSDGVWFGTPHNLAQTWDDGALARRMPQMAHEHLLLYGKQDYWIPREHVDRMAAALPNCRLEVFPYVGHSMNIEQPLLFARIFSDFLRARPGSP